MADLARMYDVADARPLREQLVRLYAQRAEPEATDKLLDIARTGTDPDMRRLAISALSRKNDPRTKKLLLEIIDK
jgi:HEAT repeat protein